MQFELRGHMLILFFSAVFTGLLSFTFVMYAAGNLSGYAWADESAGWFSFNCSNAGVCGTSNYGVTVAQNGTMSGYGWASQNDGAQNHIGWIDFAPSGPYPASSFVPAQPVRLNPGTGVVAGWARACGVFASGCSGALRPNSELGGWDGWIAFGSGGNYSRPVTVTGCAWDGYGWGGGINIGWIHFRGLSYGVSASGDGCVSSAPSAPLGLTVDETSLTVCGAIALGWTDTSSSENRFELERKRSGDSDASYGTIAELASNAVQFTDTGSVGGFSQNIRYAYRLRACNAFGCSAYSNAVSATNQSPSAAFSWTPSFPLPQRNVLFDASSSAAYGGSSITLYRWIFTDGTPASLVSGEPTAVVKFSMPPLPPQKAATLAVTDSASRQCSLSRFVTIRSGATSPGWVEVSPE